MNHLSLVLAQCYCEPCLGCCTRLPVLWVSSHQSHNIIFVLHLSLSMGTFFLELVPGLLEALRSVLLDNLPDLLLFSEM
jgi:hypothetical protein